MKTSPCDYVRLTAPDAGSDLVEGDPLAAISHLGSALLAGSTGEVGGVLGHLRGGLALIQWSSGAGVRR